MALELHQCGRYRSFCKHGVQRQRQDFLKNLYQLKEYKATELVNKFPNK